MASPTMTHNGKVQTCTRRHLVTKTALRFTTSWSLLKDLKPNQSERSTLFDVDRLDCAGNPQTWKVALELTASDNGHGQTLFGVSLAPQL